MNKLFRTFFGESSIRSAGAGRVWRGLRDGDRRDLLMGAAFLGFAYLRNTGPKKELLYRKELPVGSTIVVRHAKKGEPKIEVIKP